MVDILILDNEENYVCWLNPDLLDVTETNEKGKLKTITISHPITDKDRDYPEWYRQGNKVYVSKTADTDSCLYIIDADYEVDYYDKDLVSVEAEEILVELNYVSPYFHGSTSAVKITKANLEEWFGHWFIVDEFETPSKTEFYPQGSMTRMSLLRLLEEETENIFITRYEKEENTNLIKRYLNFKNSENVGITHSTPIEAGYNTDKIVLEVDESDSYRAVAPILTPNSTDDSSTVNTEVNVVDFNQVVEDFYSLSVIKGEQIPMIVEKNSDGTPNYTAYWAAPYEKLANEFFVRDDLESDINYYVVINRPDSSRWRLPKTGTVSTSDTDKYAIYNDCVLKIFDKRYPTVKLTADVLDIRKIEDNEDRGYNVHDKVYVKIPGYVRLISAYITKTVKDPNLQGSNKITASNADIIAKINQISTKILAEDMETNYGSGAYFNLQLVDEENKPLSDKLVSVNISGEVTATTTATTVTNNTVANTSKQTYTFYITTDRIASPSSDTNMINRLAETLKSMGHKAVVLGRDPDLHNRAYKSGCTGANDVLLCCFGGVDVGCIEEWTGELGTWFKKAYKDSKVLAIFYTKPYGGAANVYGHVGKAWDANYGWALDNPAQYMTERGISFIQKGTVDEVVTALQNGKIEGAGLSGITSTVTEEVVENVESTETNTTTGTMNKTYNLTTDSEGKANLQINLYAATYKLKINYGGDLYYGKANKTVKCIVTGENVIDSNTAVVPSAPSYDSNAGNWEAGIPNTWAGNAAKDIIHVANATDDESRARAIANWVRDNISYGYYENTKYGAEATYKRKNGNCCDTSHVMVALMRAVGLEANYWHVTCNFRSYGVQGHVLVKVKINGAWVSCDGVCSSAGYNGICGTLLGDRSGMVQEIGF